MEISSHINKLSPTEFAQFLGALQETGKFAITCNFVIEPISNELSKQETLAFLNISSRKLHDLTKSGIIKMHKVNNRCIYNRENLEHIKAEGLY